MKFICAGLAKTGTKSLSHALRVLGYKVYDYDDQFLHYGDEWYNLYFKNKVPDFYHMFKDVDAVVDVPSCFFFEELMEAFPEAKVILSIRRNEDEWVPSFKNQLEMFNTSYMTRYRLLSPTYNLLRIVFLKHMEAAYGTTDRNASYILRKRYRWHNDRVRSVVPAEKLLVYSVDQGWKPLCEFTGKKIPDQPFPHLNVKGDIYYTFLSTEFGKKIEGEVNLVKNCILGILVVFVAVLLGYFLKYI